MSGSSSSGFIHGILIGGGIVFFVAGIIIVAGIPGGILGPSMGGNRGGTSTPAPATTTTSVEKTSAAATTAQGTTKSTTSTPTTAAQTTSTTRTTTTTTTGPSEAVQYRVNVGGNQLPGSDGGPSWEADTETDPSRFGNARVSGSHTNSTSDSVSMTSAVPPGTPEAMFQSRRYDADIPDQPSTHTEMQYRFPVRNGKYEVRLYFAETYFDKQSYKKEGPRKFDVEIEGKRVLNDYDMYKELGHDRGTMKSYTVKAKDGVIDVRFIHEREDPMLSGIEIVRVSGGEKGKNHDRDDHHDREWTVSASDQPLAAVTKSGLETPVYSVR